MPPTSSVWAFALVSFFIIVVPGPSVTFIIGRAFALGSRAAVRTVIGNAGGLAVQVGAVALGLGAVVAASAAVFSAIRYLGAAYLVWLGVSALRRRTRADLDPDISRVERRTSARIQVVDGFVVGLLNPKSIVFLAAILPQYVDDSRGTVWAQLLVLGGVFVALALVLDSVWATAAGQARAWFARSARREVWLTRTGGVVMIGLGLRLAVFDGRAAD